jgi:hypothetical protein
MRLNFNQQKTSSMLNTLWFLVEYALVSGWIPGGFCSLLDFCAFGTIWNEIEKDFLNENERTIFEWEGFGRRWENERMKLRDWEDEAEKNQKHLGFCARDWGRREVFGCTRIHYDFVKIKREMFHVGGEYGLKWNLLHIFSIYLQHCHRVCISLQV